MRAVFLDAATLGDDVDLAPIAAAVDDWVCHDHTSADQTLARIQGFDTVITNKVQLTAEHFAACPGLRQVAVTATGTNNIDLDAAAQAGVRVVNVIRYGRASVAQHTLMLILALAGRFAGLPPGCATRYLGAQPAILSDGSPHHGAGRAHTGYRRLR